MMNDKKSPVQKFLEGKGFYIALALCVAGTGTAAWLAVNRTIDDIDDQNQKILESRPQTEDFTDPGEVDAEQNGVTISSEGEDSSSDVSSSQEPAAQPSGGSASSVPQNTSALQFSLPVAGEKLNPYSDGKLVKDATLGEWRTHDGLDLKAAKGTPVMRPLFLQYEDDPRSYTEQFEYLYGPDLLVAPVWQSGKTEWEVYLPSDEWTSLWTGESLSKGTHTVPAEMGYIPVFCRKGSQWSALFDSIREKYGK